MIHYRRNVRRKDGLRVVVYRDGGVCPPEKRLRQRRAVVELNVYLQRRAVWKQRHSGHSLGAEHVFNFADGDGAASVRIFKDFAVHRVKRARTVMLRPVELDSAGNPGPGKAYEGGFDHLIVVDKIIAVRLVVGALNAPAEFRQNHDKQILIFEAERLINRVARFVADRFDDGMRINLSRTALIDAFFKKNGVALGFSHRIGGNDDLLAPNTHPVLDLFELLALHRYCTPCTTAAYRPRDHLLRGNRFRAMMVLFHPRQPDKKASGDGV